MVKRWNLKIYFLSLPSNVKISHTRQTLKTIKNMDAMQVYVAKPIYDSVFKYIMENDRKPKLFYPYF